MNQSNQTLSHLRCGAAALLVALLFVQVAHFEHFDEHALEDGSENCTICVQLDRSDDAVAVYPVPVPEDIDHVSFLAQPAITQAVARSYTRQVRAPPVV